MFKVIKLFFKFVWRTFTWLRAAVFNLVFLFLVIALIQGIKSAPKIDIPNQSVLFLAPSGALVDQSTYNPSLADLLSTPQEHAPETVIHDLIRAIELARDDAAITGIALRLDRLTSAGMSKIEEIGQAIRYFQQSGKPVVAFADAMNQQQYLLASYADEIYIHNMGSLYLTGFGAYRNYYKTAAEKLSVKFHVFRVGEYKDAIEPFVRDDMSPESKEHIEQWLNALWARYTNTVETHRALSPGSVDILLSTLDSELLSLNGNAAKLAVDKGLVDASFSKEELKNHLLNYFNQEENEELNTISAYAYLNNPTLNRVNSTNKIGLIVATGTILDGHQPESAIGAATLSQLIQKAREDKEVGALVIRVDSGGGSAFASEVIREQIKITRESGKPVYISMGSVAASGGYWISTPADEIWATPTTLTGSIGVFGLIPNFADSLNKLGIYSDGLGTSDLSDSYHLDRPLSERAQKIIQTSVDNIYHQFISLVAEARNSDYDSIHNIAQGRVWFGEQAQTLGLVDKLGTLKDVINSAANNLDYKNYEIKPIKRELSTQEKLMRTLAEQASIEFTNRSALGSLVNQGWIASTLLNNQEFQLLNHALSKNTQHAQSAAPLLSAYAHCGECIAP